MHTHVGVYSVTTRNPCWLTMQKTDEKRGDHRCDYYRDKRSSSISL
jgi:hypothetical protein